jgi:hypothetical protein
MGTMRERCRFSIAADAVEICTTGCCRINHNELTTTVGPEFLQVSTFMTIPITRFGADIPNVFALAGIDENSATGALGWVLSQSKVLLDLLLTDLGMPCSSEPDIRIDLQRRADDAGFTDIEIRAKAFHCIIEAKVGIAVAHRAQLERYVDRMGRTGSRIFLSISDAPASFAGRSLPAEVQGVAVRHRTWRDIQSQVRKAAKIAANSTEKLWLRQLERHLEKYVTGSRINDNTVYVVSLSDASIETGGTYTWIDVVREGFYFHPAGKGWPSEPPNYIGFRYGGKLQAIHHIEDWNVVDCLKDKCVSWPENDVPHFVYRLGPAIIPATEVRSGNIWSARNYVAIDLLLSGACRNIGEAVAATKQRLEGN